MLKLIGGLSGLAMLAATIMPAGTAIAAVPPQQVPPECAGGTYDSIIYLINTPGVQGNSQRNIIIGTYGDDVIDGGAGNDCIIGLGGNDRILGGSGNDIIVGYEDFDRIDGGSGTDKCSGEVVRSCEASIAQVFF